MIRGVLTGEDRIDQLRPLDLYSRAMNNINKSKLCLLSTAEVSELLSIAPRTVCFWAESSELPGVKIGRQWRFRVSDIEGWLTARSHQSYSGPPQGAAAGQVSRG